MPDTESNAVLYTRPADLTVDAQAHLKQWYERNGITDNDIVQHRKRKAGMIEIPDEPTVASGSSQGLPKAKEPVPPHVAKQAVPEPSGPPPFKRPPVVVEEHEPPAPMPIAQATPVLPKAPPMPTRPAPSPPSAVKLAAVVGMPTMPKLRGSIAESIKTEQKPEESAKRDPPPLPATSVATAKAKRIHHHCPQQLWLGQRRIHHHCLGQLCR